MHSLINEIGFFHCTHVQMTLNKIIFYFPSAYETSCRKGTDWIQLTSRRADNDVLFLWICLGGVTFPEARRS